MATCSRLGLILARPLNTVSNLTPAILHKTGISQVLHKASSLLKQLDMITMANSNPNLSSSHSSSLTMGLKVATLVITTISLQHLVDIANKGILRMDMGLGTQVMASHL